MQNYWFESLPESCPPADSEKCQGIYYRVAIGNPASLKISSLKRN